MANAVLNIGAAVDKDAIVSGMAEGAAGVKTATANISVYFQDLQSRASGSWKKISEDTRAAASSINAESLKIAEATKAVTVAQRELSAAMSLARNSSVDEAASMAVLAAAQANVRTKLLELKEAQEAVAVSSHKAVTDVQATSAAIRSLEGNAGMRAVENFIAKTLNIGPAMAAIFPVVGALAFGTILFDMAEKLIDLRIKGKESADELARGFGEMDAKLAATNDQLELQNSKIEDQIAKLSGHPTNGLQTALLEARVAAERLQESLAADLKTFQALLKERDVSFFEGALSNLAPTKSTTKEITEFQRSVEKQGNIAEAAYAKAFQDAAGSHEKQEAATRAYYGRMDEISAEAARKMRARATEVAQEQAKVDALGAASPNGSVGYDMSQRRDSFEDAAVVFDKQQRHAQISGASFQDDQDLGGAKKKKEDAALAKEAASKGAEERMRGMEAEYGELQQMHRFTLKEEHDFWEARVGEFAKGSEQYKQLQDKLGQIDQQGAAKAGESIRKLIEQEKSRSASDVTASAEVAKAIEDVNRLVREQAEDVTQTGERWQSYNAGAARGAEAAAKLHEAMQEGQLRILEQEHGITALGAAQAQARIHTEEHTRALKALQDELAALQAAGAGMKPGDKGYEQNASQQQNVQNQIQQETGQGQVQKQQDVAAISAAIAKPYLTAFNAIDAGWLKVQHDLIQGNKNISRDFAQMGLGLVQAMAQYYEKMIVDHLKAELLMVIHHRASVAQKATADAAANAQKVATDTAAAATQATATSTANVASALSYAAVAAAGAAAATAVIPVVGPLLAPEAAAATYAATAAYAPLAAFAQGGVVGGGSSYQMGVPILAHAGERVLSYDQTQKFEGLVNRPSSSNSQTIHMGNHTYNGSNNGDFVGELHRNQMKLVKLLKRLKREGHI